MVLTLLEVPEDREFIRIFHGSHTAIQPIMWLAVVAFVLMFTMFSKIINPRLVPCSTNDDSCYYFVYVESSVKASLWRGLASLRKKGKGLASSLRGACISVQGHFLLNSQ